MTQGEDSREARVATLFAQRRRALGISLPELAAAAGVDRHRLQRLLAPGGAHVRLDEVAALAEALHVPHGELTRLLWPQRPLLADDPELAWVLRPGSSAPDSPTAEQLPTLRLIRMLATSPNWAFTVGRVYGGPAPQLQFHVQNRFAVVPSPTEFPLPDHLHARRRFLKEFGGLPPGVRLAVWQGTESVPDHFPHDPAGGHPASTGAPALYLQSSVYAADRPADGVPTRLRGAAASGIVVLGLRAISQSLRVAATVARALGWAFVDVSRASSRLTPALVEDPRASARNETLYRNIVLGEYLAAPAPQTVVSHVGTPVTDDAGAVVADHALLAADRDTLPFVVLVRPSDALLERSLELPVNAAGGRSRLTLSQLLTWRDALVARVSQLQARGRGVVVSLPDSWARAAIDERTRDYMRWRAHTQSARHIVQDVLHLSGMRSGFAVRDPTARALLSFDSPVAWD